MIRGIKCLLLIYLFFSPQADLLSLPTKLLTRLITSGFLFKLKIFSRRHEAIKAKEKMRENVNCVRDTLNINERISENPKRNLVNMTSRRIFFQCSVVEIIGRFNDELTYGKKQQKLNFSNWVIAAKEMKLQNELRFVLFLHNFGWHLILKFVSLIGTTSKLSAPKYFILTFMLFMSEDDFV